MNVVFLIALFIVAVFVGVFVIKLFKPKSNTTNPMNRFKSVMTSIQNSDYVKGIQEEQKTAKPDEFMPSGLTDKKQEDVFSTDFSKVGKTDL